MATGDANVLNNRHANTTIPKFLGALQRYMTLGDVAGEYLTYVQKFWDMVVERHTYATGGNSEWEHFGEDFVLDAERTNCNNETCNTYNMLKMSRDLFRITGDKKYADYYENTFRVEFYSNKESKEAGTAEIIIGKQRNGPIGSVRLAFEGQYTRFSNLSPEYYSQYDDEE